MGRAISVFCCLIVGLQVLVGVPLVICGAFYLLLVARDTLGPVSLEVHSGHASPATIPPPNLIPQPADIAINNPILQTRAERGSPLAGTVLESSSPAEEQDLFVAAIEKVAAEKPTEPTLGNPPSVPLIPSVSPAPSDALANLRQNADQFAIHHLYAIAESDEQAGEYQRADQWRALAREIRRGESRSESQHSSPADTLTKLPDEPELPY